MNMSLYGKNYGNAQDRDIARVYQNFIRDELGINKKHYVLEIGCGSGSLVRFLEGYSDHVFGTDINQEQIDKANIPNIIRSDIQHLPYKNTTFDRIISLHTLEHIPDLYKVMKELDRVAKPGCKALHIFPAHMITKAEGAYLEAIQMAHGNILKAWKIAHQLHIHRLNPTKIGNYCKDTRWKLEIKRYKRIFIPKELGFAWIIFLTK